MSRNVYVASPEDGSGKSTVALGLVTLLGRLVGKVGIFRPVVDSSRPVDRVVELLLAQPAVEQEYADAIGVGSQEWRAHTGNALARIVDRFQDLCSRYDALVVVGSDDELGATTAIAANLGAPVVLVVHGRRRSAEQVRLAAELARADLVAAHAHLVAVIANRVDPDSIEQVRDLLTRDGGLPVGVIPEMRLLAAPVVADLVAACDGELVRGNPAWLNRESMGFVVAAMSLPNVLIRLVEDVTVIAPGDRYDLLPALLMAHQSGVYPRLSAVVLTGGYALPEPVDRLIYGAHQDLPIIVAQGGTFETGSALAGVRGKLTARSTVKVESALRLFEETVDKEKLLAAIDVGVSDVLTPVMFQHRLIERARLDRRRIVLPEGEDDRIVRAAASLLRSGVAELTLLGEEIPVHAAASAAGVDISGATVLSRHDPELVATFAKEYSRIRAHKGMTEEQAAEIVTDASYFGTMMVHLGLADGMVSGAVHTTAHTIKPSFEIIKTAPGTTIVSSVFLMCLADRVLIYGDCAVNPDPTAQELADIAISSAGTAAQFGITPRVAMLSYSTGASGSGADVDMVREATAIVHRTRPDLLVEGPIQYDAAVDPEVAAAKLPESRLAGRATVLIFPDLNTGNNTYKAVQRSANAVAIGPVLQGLNKPINDLSRGALVADIINTVAITAIQAQGSVRESLVLPTDTAHS